MRLIDEFNLAPLARKIKDAGLGFEGAVRVSTKST